jgi:hypothetical protein
MVNCTHSHTKTQNINNHFVLIRLPNRKYCNLYYHIPISYWHQVVNYFFLKYYSSLN